MAKDCPLYSADTTLGWRVTRRISRDQAERMHAQGRLRSVEDEFGNFLGYQMTGRRQDTDQDLPSLGSSAAITAAESQRNAGLSGQSRTVRMSEEDRLCRRSERGKLLPAEDAIERAQAKVAAYTSTANVQGDRAVRVYPKAPRW